MKETQTNYKSIMNSKQPTTTGQVDAIVGKPDPACVCCGYKTKQVYKYKGKCYQCFVDNNSPSQEVLEKQY